MQEYGEYRSMVSAHRCYLRSRGHVSGHHHGNKGGFHAGVDPRPSQSGWMVSMALYALVYRQYPAAAQSRFAMLHFWIANVGAVLLVVGIYTQMADMPSLAFIVISGSFITILGMLIFTVIVYSKV